MLLWACTFTPAEQSELSASDNHNQQQSTGEKDYWYKGVAEISSYQLKQARYGEIRKGHAVLIFVTEPFSKTTYTKADRQGNNDESVLKLNFTKKFNTGIYPYSMMTSTFLPFDAGKHSLKISSSSQEWCGHTYMEMIRKDKLLNITTSSYFQGENRQQQLALSFLEDDFWSLIRLRPSQLPVGKHQVIPSFFYLRLKHKETKAYTCELSLQKNGDSQVYRLHYPELNRNLKIEFNTAFPHEIMSWQEQYPDGWTTDAPMLSTTGTLLKQIQTAYWQKNQNKHLRLRDSLLLTPQH